jgi:hypothetical protein
MLWPKQICFCWRQRPLLLQPCPSYSPDPFKWFLVGCQPWCCFLPHRIPPHLGNQLLPLIWCIRTSKNKKSTGKKWKLNTLQENRLISNMLALHPAIDNGPLHIFWLLIPSFYFKQEEAYIQVKLFCPFLAIGHILGCEARGVFLGIVVFSLEERSSVCL